MAAGKFKCGHFLHPFPFALGEGLVIQNFPLYPFGFVTVVAPGRIFVAPVPQPVNQPIAATKKMTMPRKNNNGVSIMGGYRATSMCPVTIIKLPCLILVI